MLTHASTFINVVRHRADTQPQRQAYTFLTDGEIQTAHLTYAELDQQARTIAAILQTTGKPGDRVLLLYPPGLDYIAAFLGCLYAGMVAVPAYAPGPTHLGRRDRALSKRLFAIIEDARPVLGLTTSTLLNRINSLKQSLPEMQTVNWLTTEQFSMDYANLWNEPPVRAESIAMLQYTSGSTRLPRGVILTHSNLLHNSAFIQKAFGQTSESRSVIWLPPYHDMGLIGGILQPLYTGYPAVLMAPVAFLQQPIRWLQAISDYRATTSGGPNFAYSLCVSKITEEQKASLDLQSWQTAFNGAEPVRDQTLERFAQSFASCGFRRQAFQPCYGLAEATLLVSSCQAGSTPTIQSFVASALEQNKAVLAKENIQNEVRTYVSCGAIPGGTHLHIVNHQTGNLCQAGEVGEIWLAGPHIAQGYWQRVEETLHTFQARLADEPDQCFLRTGDLGFLLNQELFITGRLKDLIIIRGQNHYPQDIEQTVEQSHLALRASSNAAFTSRQAEGDEEKLIIVQELERQYQRENVAHIAEIIRKAVAEKHELQIYAIVLIKTGSIPKTSSGKIQRRSCQALFEAGELETIYSEIQQVPLQALSSNTFERQHEDLLLLAPGARRTQLITQLTNMLAQALKVDPSSIRKEQSLSALGMDSLLMIELSHTIEMYWGLSLPLADLWQDTGIDILADSILDALKTQQADQSLDPEDHETSKEKTFDAPFEKEDAFLPLTYGQRGLYFLQQMAPTSTAYHITVSLRITSMIDVAALKRAFSKLVERHPVLNSTFQIDQNQPVQRIHKHGTFDFRHEEVQDTSNRLRQRLSAEAQRPIDLANGPLLRLLLLSLHSQEHIFLFVTHHLVLDFWSLVVLARDLGALYTAEKNQQTPLLTTPSVAYRTFVSWQQKMLEGGEGEQHLAYWRHQLADDLPSLNLPIANPRPAVQTQQGASAHYSIDAQLTSYLKSLAQEQQVSLFMLLLSTFYVLLHRYTEQEDILVGSPVTGRSSYTFANLVGYLANTVVLRANLSNNPSFLSLLQQVRHTTLAALAHQDYPFPLLVERLQPERDLSRSPLFQVMFILQKAHLFDEKLALFALGQEGHSLELGGLTVEPYILPQQAAQYDLTLMMAEVEGRLLTTWQYNADLFVPSAIEQLNRHFQTLLGGIVQDPRQNISQIPLMSQEEQTAFLQKWQNSDHHCTPPRFLQHLIEQVNNQPDAVAILANAHQLTYMCLHQQANQLAHYLQLQGVRPETFVGVYLPRIPDMIVALLAILQAGGTIVALDPTYPQERLVAMAEDANLRYLIVNEALLQTSVVRQSQSCIICLDQQQGSIAQQSSTNLDEHVTDQHLAYLIYTSGSTGRPKGAMLPMRSFHNMISWQTIHANLKAGEKTLQYTSLNFDVSLQEIFPTLASGGTIVMIDEEQHLDPVALLQLIDVSGTQRVYLPPAILQYLAETAQHLQVFPQQLHTIIVAGDQLKITQQIKQFFQKLKACRFDNQCGPSETHVATAFTFTEPENWPFLPPIGRPITNVSIYLLDAWMQPVPQGAIGEIYISGAGLGRGYLHRPELTAEKFLPHPFSHEAGARLYKTGDLACYQNDGNIVFLGRSDHQIKIRGVRIELGEIEARLNQHPAIRESVVTLTQQKQNDRYLAAYIVTQPDTQVPSVEQLRSFLKHSLVEQMVPSAFVFLEALPLSINGKLNRAALPQPETTRTHLASAYAIPQTTIEQAIASIWSDVLQLKAPGIYDNFFDSGGHSLLIMEMQRQLFQVLGYSIPIVDLFKYPTISSLAEHISKSNMPQPATAPTRQKKSRPPSQSEQDIAIIGLAGRFPGSPNLQAFWQHLCAGDEMITRFSDEELKAAGVPESLLHNPAYVKAGAVLENADLFAASFFGFNAREAEMMDPQQRIFLECAWEALENAAYDPERYPGEIGVFAGTSMNTYLFFNLASNMDLIHQIGEYQTMLGNDKDFLATRVSYKLNLKGPGVTVQTACSTSLVAVHMACRSLIDQECDIALAGGVAIRFPQTAGYLFQEGGILSPDGHCRAFSQEAQGTVPGSGVGAVILKPLAKAIADSDHIYAVIKGSAINNDGSLKAGYTAPSVEGQARAIASALAHAGIAPETVSYIETHGTGTHLGDPIEIAALNEVYRSQIQAQASCAIGSLKTNIGHADTAAGIAGLLKVILALQHQLLPPSLHYSQANPQIDFAHSPFYVNTALAPWTTDHLPLRAGISSLGIGGTNAHVIIEQAPEQPATTASWPWQILPFSAKTEQELEALLNNFQAYLEHLPEERNIADIAYTLQVGRKEFAKRAVLLCREDAQDAIHALADRTTDRLFRSVSEPGKKAIIFLFPGQGAQYVDMTRELYATFAFFRQQIDQCAILLFPHLGIDIRTILYPDQDTHIAKALLEQTYLTQPALFAVEYALATLLRHWQIEPYALIGHSIGEYVAACLAGIFSLEDALHLVTLRGKLIQQLPHGSMLSVHLGEQDASTLCIEYPELSLAAINSSTLSTISGPDEAITRLEQELLLRQISYRRLHTSHAFHSAMMDSILDDFQATVSKIALYAPQIGYISNVTGTWITSAQATDPHYWVKHLRQTVRFADGLVELQKLPGSIFLEVGPGFSLTTFLRQENQKHSISLAMLPHPQEKQPELAVFLKALSQIWLAGVSTDWQAYWEGTIRRRLPIPAYPLTRQRYLVTPQPRESNQISSPALAKKESDINKWFYLPSWQQMPQLDTTYLQDRLNSDKQLWLIFSNDCSIIQQMATQLQQADQELLIVRAGSRFAQLETGHYTINPTQREDYRRLLQRIYQAGQHIQRVIHAWTLTDTLQASDFSTMQDLGYYSLLYLAQTLEQTGIDNASTVFQPLPIELISNFLCALTDLEPLDPHKATLLGPCKVISQEHSEIRCRCFDIILPATGSQQERALSEQLLAEITSESSDLLVALRGRQRWLQSATRITPASSPSTAKPIRHQGVYLITGGLGSLGLTIATHLSRQYQANLVLLGRSSLPAREDWSDWVATHDTQDRTTSKIQQIQALEQFGSRVHLISADVASKQQMSHAVQQIEQHFGTLHGVIHTAGITTGDSIYRPFTEISRPLSEEQFRAKVQGLFVLEELLNQKSLDFCLLFSSNAATLGGLGLAAYSAANLFMNAFAKEHNARERTPWLSINWDGWEQAASKQGLQQYASFSGGIERYTMTAEEGIQAFERALTLLSLNEVIISPGDFTTRLDLWVKHRQPVRTTALEQPVYERPLPQSTYHEPRNEIERSIVNIWELLLGVTPIGVDDNFFELGGHSLLATQFTTRMQETFGIKFPLQCLFETPTIAGLAERTVQELASQVDEALLEQIEQFTGSEVETGP